MDRPSLNLSQLALQRNPANLRASTSSIPHRKRWLSRYVLPAAILFGFTALVVASAGSRLLPARVVTVIPVIVKRAAVQQPGTTLFQSPGWIEPRPMAMSVAALAPGVIEELMVVAGQKVEKGQAIARLVSVDAELALQQAKNALAIRQGELNRAHAELTAARVRVENPVHLRVQLADAQSNLSKSITELAKLPFLIEAAEANVKYAQSSLEGKQSVRGVIADNVIAKAENDFSVAVANLKELQERKPNLERELQALKAVVSTLEHQLDLLVEEKRQLGEAEAKVQSAEAYRNDAQLQVQQAELTLERNTVRAPMAGRILRLVASPGSRVMGLETTAGQSSSTVVEMYDPQSLQVRADVRLEDVPLVTIGQPVEIETASSKGTIRGRVLQITSSANIQKNTLEVKVELVEPPSTVSPEMLVTATFLAPQLDSPAETSNEVERVFVPRQLIQSSELGSFVWIVDEKSTACTRIVELENRSTGELTAVKSGLSVTDKLITTGLESLKVGMRVQVGGDDLSIGIN